jgi:hypothetical protein
MSPLEPAATPGLSQSCLGRFHPALQRFVPALFAATLFGSALLLFSIQPMFTKMVLPRLGGAPAVWSVAMVFFQGALLAGYAYAHLLVRRFEPARGALIHLGLLAVAAASLPIGIAAGFGATPTSYVGPWLIALFAASIGLPFAALSASAPLLQAWFAATDHGEARNPYVLYAASNLGSFAGLIAYPFVIEPILPLRDGSGDDARAGGPRGAGAAAPGATGVARARGHSVWPHRRRHRASGDGCCGGSIPLGGAARALSPDLRCDLPPPAMGQT